jgi:hypothetical protein
MEKILEKEIILTFPYFLNIGMIQILILPLLAVILWSLKME